MTSKTWAGDSTFGGFHKTQDVGVKTYSIGKESNASGEATVFGDGGQVSSTVVSGIWTTNNGEVGGDERAVTGRGDLGDGAEESGCSQRWLRWSFSSSKISFSSSLTCLLCINSHSSSV